ncbi:c-type cytochrome [Vibrio sp. SM6]|uniref:C-type cytochrome n=1 Tax=Vibrio agarilyticus TaxID=2726741 RepID=A0A7X8YFQ7_9VIBR|nr:c-type cytochrome [Vibrio agarilyticus]NLS11919.1 c-type cytochrome [Vibrio agarilyticus]
MRLISLCISSLCTFSLSVVAAVATAAEPSPLISEGEALYRNPGRGGCVQCHGEAGNRPVVPLYPKIGGQSEQYLYNQLIDYREKRRKNGLYIPMEIAMQPFSDAEIKAMSAYLAAQNSF